MGKIRENFGDRVKRLRKSLGFTQVDLAEKSNISIQMIKDIERGRSPGGAKSYSGLSKALGVSIEALTEGETAEPNKVVLRIPPSETLRMYMAIPDKIIELAQNLPKGDVFWEDMETFLERRLKILADESARSKKSV